MLLIPLYQCSRQNGLL